MSEFGQHNPYPLRPGRGSRVKSVLQRNELLEMAEEVASLGHWMIDLDEDTLFWSEQVYRIHDVAPEDYTPDVESAINFYHPEDAERVSGLLSEAIADRQPFEFEFRLLRRDGSVRIVHSCARVRVEDDDRVTAVFGTFHDITVRRRAEDLRSSILRLTADGGLTSDQKLVRLLQLGRRYYGADAAFIEEQRTDSRRLVHVDDTHDVLCSGQVRPGQPAVVAGDASIDAVLRLEEHLGQVCAWLDDAGQSEFFRYGLGHVLRVNGRVFGSVWFASRTGTAQAFSEPDPSAAAELVRIIGYELAERERAAALARSLEAQKAKQHELDMVLDNVRSVIFYKDGNNTILLLNSQAARTMGLTREEVEGRNTADFFPEMAEKYLADDREVIASNKPRLGIVERYTPSEGPHRWITTDKIPFPDPQTGESRILAVATDITDLVDAKQRLEEQAMQLQRSNDDLDQFAHVAAHDLRTPLRGMRHLVEWLGEDISAALPDEVPGPVTEKLDLLTSRVARMDRMLNDMLTFARANGEDFATTDTTTDLNAILREAPDWVAAHTGFKVCCEQADFCLSVARTPLEQLLMNLVTNAVHHHDRDSGMITISMERGEHGVAVTVTDDGPGIEPAYHDTVFEAFETLRRRDEVDSTGIGLAVVKRIMTSVGGAVTLKSPIDQRGSAFTLSFPDRLVTPADSLI